MLHSAFPSLRYLELFGFDLGNSSVLTKAPQFWPHLHSICLGQVNLRSNHMAPVASALAALPNLTHARVGMGAAFRTATQLTRLTSLWVPMNEDIASQEEAVQLASQNPGLKTVILDQCDLKRFPAYLLSRLLLSCRHITHLDLNLSILDSLALGALLQHGRQLDTLTVQGFCVHGDSLLQPCPCASRLSRTNSRPHSHSSA
jgi:hypothetical protein